MRSRIVLLEDRIRVVGVIRNRNLRGREIEVVAFGRTPYGLVLSFVLTHARPVMACGVSKGYRSTLEDPDEVMERIQERVRSEGGLPNPDPCPLLESKTLDELTSLPAGVRFDGPGMAWVVKQTMPGLLLSMAAFFVVAGAAQAALPQTYPWLLLAPVFMFLVFALLPMPFVVMRYRPLLRQSVATTANWIGVRERSGWKGISLEGLRGIGISRSVIAMSVFALRRIRAKLILVDAEGHRLDVDQLSLTAQVKEVLRAHAANAAVTETAARALAI